MLGPLKRLDVIWLLFDECILQTVKKKDIFSGEDTETADMERG
jgi:hypothetical protein